MRDYKTWRIVIDGRSNEPLIRILEDTGNNSNIGRDNVENFPELLQNKNQHIEKA